MKRKQVSENFLRKSHQLASLYDIAYKLGLLYDDCNRNGMLDDSKKGKILYECFDVAFKKLSQVECIIKS